MMRRRGNVSGELSRLEGHAFSLVLEGLVHERRQVPLAEAREDRLQPPTKNKLGLISTVVAADHIALWRRQGAYDDELAPVLGPPGDPDGGGGGRARRYPDLKEVRPSAGAELGAELIGRWGR